MNQLSRNLTRIVKQLNDGKFHHSTTLGEKLNMTRVAIRQAIKKLDNYGIVIESSNSDGYQLIEPLVLLNRNCIKKSMQHKINIDVLETIHSTMDYFATDHADKRINACFAEMQTAGRGRFNREWHAPFAQNINLSLQYPSAKDISQLAGLSLAVGLSICQTLEKYNLSKSLKLKWPNDLIYDNKKLGGILIECQTVSNGCHNAIIGIGINVNLLSNKQIAQPWTSLRNVTGSYIDRNRLSGQLLDDLLDHINTFINLGLAPFSKRWKSYDYLHGKQITLGNFNNKISGIVHGINQQGYLLLKQKNGIIIPCSSGDTTIVKPHS